MHNYILKVIGLLSIISSSVYAYTSLKCGLPYGTISKQISNQDFHYFQTNSFTWIVSIKKINVNHENNFCKGFLIHSHAVLTAAHCVQNESEESLRVQANIMKGTEKFLVKKTFTRKVSEILIHPYYSACDASLNHAILRLAKPFPVSRQLNIICLPTFEQISLAGDCGYTLININSHDLWNIPGRSNTCELMDISKQDGSIYAYSSCERGKNNTDLILDIAAQLESCEIPCGSDQFFYFGMNIEILYNCDYRTIIMSKNDNLYDNLNWITSILRDKF